MKKRCHRKHLIAVPPRGLRPKLPAHDLRKLGLYHVENLDAIATGEAEAPMLWDYLEQVLTWWKAAELLGLGELEMGGQLEIATRLVERYARTGAVRFDGLDYQAARIGLRVMDTLAAEVDTVTAMQAAIWSTIELARMSALAVAMREQEARST